MRYSKARLGRVFVVRLEQDDPIPDSLEELARREKINAASVLLVGGIESGRIVVGPKARTSPPVPVTRPVAGRHEILAAGFIFPTDGKPVLHMHGAFGRGAKTLVGCTRTGVRVFSVVEAVVTEILDSPARRTHDPHTGWHLLQP
ncbi:MAG: PPC domain-containing DNA-binding protein [Planctomycetota bacterium]